MQNPLLLVQALSNTLTVWKYFIAFINNLIPERLWEILIIVLTALLTAYLTSQFQYFFNRKSKRNLEFRETLADFRKNMNLLRMTTYQRLEAEVFFNFYAASRKLKEDDILLQQQVRMDEMMRESEKNFYHLRGECLKQATKLESIIEQEFSKEVRDSIDSVIVNYKITFIKDPDESEELELYKKETLEEIQKKVNTELKSEMEDLYSQLLEYKS